MKKILYILLFLVISQTNVFSQNFGGGVFAGLSASQLDGDNWGGYHKAGFTFGVYTNAKLNKYIDAQLELRYVQKGSRSTGDETVVYYLSKLNYVEMPIFLKYHFLNRFSANVGIAGGYLQKSTEDKDGLGDQPASPEFSPFELSGLAGVEYQILDKLFFNIRLNYSILPVRSHPGDQTYFLNQGQYNNTLTFNVYYQISKANERKGSADCGCDKRSKRFNIR